MKHRYHRSSMRSAKMLIIFLCMAAMLLMAVLVPLLFYNSPLP